MGNSLNFLYFQKEKNDSELLKIHFNFAFLIKKINKKKYKCF